MRSTRFASTSCPACGHELDTATDMRGWAGVEPGDLGVCLYCARIHVFTRDGLRAPSYEERLEMNRDPEIRRLVASVKTLIGLRAARDPERMR